MREKKKLVYGVGINDADYQVEFSKKGEKKSTCPFYKRWVHMLERVYCPKYHKRQPTYKDVTICEEWHKFSCFKKWMEVQKWEGMHLDKDLISPNRKHYSPETCAFISVSLNTTLSSGGLRHKGLPKGVLKTKNNKYIAKICIDRKVKYLGTFNSILEAKSVYIDAKIGALKEHIVHLSEDRVIQGVNMHILKLKDTF